jgi:lipopolysaccharide/colanic/teichoic acid biosynthesis glycosyltransferase
MKVFLDVFMAAVLLILLSPFLILVALLVFFMDFQSPLFIQERLGRNKHKFKVIKFRSMRDGKVTFMGKIMRRTGIDELPQLINILFLEMSFVGPRPLTEADVDRLSWSSTYYDPRWSVKPGLAGLAQISPICHKKMSWFLDKYYISNHNLGLDFQIIISSLLIPIVGKAQMIKWLHKK